MADQLNAAMELALKVYRARVNSIVDRQSESMRTDQKAGPFVMYPPCTLEINLIVKALDDARDEGISEAWRVASRYTNHSETKAGSAARQQAEDISDGIKALKSSSYAVAK